MLNDLKSDKNSEKPIGVFDSGVGGLTVLRELMKELPEERIIYFGDTARVPYGSKSKDTVTRYSWQIVRFLLEQGVKAIVIACNTASAMALDEIESKVDIPMIGVVRPGARTAVNISGSGRIGVIGTEATISSEIYTEYIRSIDPAAKVTGKACPLFCPLVEEGLWEDPVTEEIARRYLMELVDTGIDTLILGCTHYPLIKNTVRKVVGDEINLVNPAYETAVECKRLLNEQGLLNKEPIHLSENAYTFYVSDEAEKFRRFANSILPMGILGAKKIDIERY